MGKFRIDDFLELKSGAGRFPMTVIAVAGQDGLLEGQVKCQSNDRSEPPRVYYEEALRFVDVDKIMGDR